MKLTFFQLYVIKKESKMNFKPFEFLDKKRKIIFYTLIIFLLIISGKNIIGSEGVVLSFIIVSISIIGFWVYHKNLILFSNLAKQVLVILLLITTFLTQAALSPITAPQNYFHMYFITCFMILTTIGVFYILYNQSLKNIIVNINNFSIIQIIHKVRDITWNNKEITLVLSLSVLFRSGMLNTMQRWDSGLYYFQLGNACANFDFTFDTFFNSFRLASHPTFGFTIIMALGEYLNPRGITGYMVVNLILTIVAIYYIYQLLRNFWSKMPKKIAALGAFMVSVTPVFLGTFGSVNIDYPLIIFFIFMVYMEYKKKYILLAFWGLVLSQTKETGLIILAGYFGVRAIMNFIAYRGKFIDKIKACIKDPVNLSALFPLFVYIAYMVKIGSISTWQPQNPYQFDNMKVHWFGIEPDYIIFKIKQLLIINFSWILIGIILFGIILLIVLLLRKRLKINSNLWGIIGVLFSFTIFSCIYVTFTIYRYNVIFDVLLTILAFIMSVKVIGKFVNLRIIIGINVVISVLFLAQAFVCVDPISNKFFRTVDTGGIPMLFTIKGAENYSDGLIHNYQYTYIDEAFNQMLSKVNYNSSITLINAGEQSESTQLNGNDAYKVSWNSKLKKRVIGENENTIPIKTYNSFELFGYLPYYSEYKTDNLNSIPTKAVVYFLPYYEENEEATIGALSQYYIIGERQIVIDIRGTLIFYELIKKDNYKGHNINEFIGINDIESTSNEKIEITDIVAQLENLTISKSVFDRNVTKLQYQYGYEIKVNKNMVEQGDSIRITCQSFVDGKEIKNLSLNKRLGVNNIIHSVGEYEFIEGFEENLLGLEKGQTYSFNCKMPLDYKIYPQYSGKDITFIISVDDIMSEVFVPQLTDESIIEFTDGLYTLDSFLYEALKSPVKEIIIDKVKTISGKIKEPYNNNELQLQIEQINDYYSLIFANSLNVDASNDWLMSQFVESTFDISYDEFQICVEKMAKTVLTEEFVLKEILGKEEIESYKRKFDANTDREHNFKDAQTEMMELEKKIERDQILWEETIKKIIKNIQIR